MSIPLSAPVRPSPDISLQTDVSPSATALALSHMRRLPFADFAAMVQTLLERLGYEDVQLVGATYSRGRNQQGGLDIQAAMQTGVTRAGVIGQIKQYKYPVPRSFVDELRGTMLRVGAQQGLLINSGPFSQAALEAAAAGQQALPVRLIAGAELITLLRQQEVSFSVPPTPTIIARASRNTPIKSPTAAQTAAPSMPPGGVQAMLPFRRTEEPEGLTITVSFGKRHFPGKPSPRSNARP